MNIHKEIRRIALTVKLPIVMRFKDYSEIKGVENFLSAFGNVNSAELEKDGRDYVDLLWEGSQPNDEEIEKLKLRAGIKSVKKGKTLSKMDIYNRRKGAKRISYIQEAWGDSSAHELVIPSGWSPEEYAKELRKNFHGAYPRFAVESGKVIEYDWNSIGD